MKAIIEFKLPEDNEDFVLASDASKMYMSLCDVDNMCRSLIKHGNNKDLSLEDFAEMVREQIYRPDVK